MTRAYQTEGIYYHYIIALFLNGYLKVVLPCYAESFVMSISNKIMP